MLRTSKGTFAATAVTLTCLWGALYASPIVVAETMQREVSTYAPMQYGSFFQQREEATLQVTDAGAPVVDSTVTDAGSASTAEATLNPAGSATSIPDDPDHVDTVPTVQDGSTHSPEQTEQTEQSEQPTSRVTSEIPQVDVTLPSDEDTATPQPTPSDDETEDAANQPVPDDLNSPESITVIVNKMRGLPEDYAPEDLVELPSALSEGTQQLRTEAAEAAEEMLVAAQEDNIELRAISSYRSYDYQDQLYETYMDEHGTQRTDNMSARPGHSEHQTGLALDVDAADGQDSLQTSFGQTDAGQWVAEHAHEYGFVIRYPEDSEDITGFEYEPWHLRYFGEQFATHIMDNSGVAETAFGLDPAPDYDD